MFGIDRDQLLNKVAALLPEGRRIEREDAARLFRIAELTEIGMLANQVRQRIHPGRIVTYLVDRNINYTNVCNSDCSFCGFYRHNPRDPEAYVNSKDVIGKKIAEALELGATRILLQGGHNDELPYDYYLDLISWIKDKFQIELNAFSPSEVHQMHRVSGKNYGEILRELQQAGLSGLPGGGAEILDDDVRKRVSPKKIGADLWIEIMEAAQDLGLTTTATMVIGLGENLEQRLNHLDRLRELQDRTQARGLKGFNCFISWNLMHNQNTSIGRSRHAASFGASASEYLKNLALCRIYLDNIPNHQSSWPTLGPDMAQVGMNFGCNDIGSTMMEENVVSAAGAPTLHRWSMSPEELRAHIRGAGFIPAQRNSSFEIVQIFE
ncbi:MAG: CofH family radical SAM protein [Oligoflexia bacterium]|nr:CofH family radical SAM protein [Oligoflexia bacterium]